MKSSLAIRPDRVVARSLRVTRTTFALVAAFTAFATTNAMITLQFLSVFGQETIFTLLFVSVAVATFAITTDIISRSSQVIANLRSLGAQKIGVASAVFFFLLIYGAAGTVLGAGLGATLGSAMSSTFGLSLATLTRAAAALGVSTTATVLGVYAGVRVAWRS